MSSIALTIPNWQPARLNELMHCHWAIKAKRKKADREIVAGYAMKAKLPKAVGKRRVSMIVTLAKGQKRGDEDGWWKSVLDALVKCGLLVNDSFDWVDIGSVTFERGDKATKIVLEDV